MEKDKGYYRIPNYGRYQHRSDTMRFEKTLQNH